MQICMEAEEKKKPHLGNYPGPLKFCLISLILFNTNNNSAILQRGAVWMIKENSKN